MTSHTPGPWYSAATSTIGHAYIVDSEGFTICAPSPMGADNARLIAAAPELLEALQSIVDAYQRHFDAMPVAWQTYDDIARAAIAKAGDER